MLFKPKFTYLKWQVKKTKEEEQMMKNLYQAYVKLFYNDTSPSNKNISQYLKDNS